jgi:hypothetical protein
MRSLRIFAVGVIGLVLTFLFVAYGSYVVLGMALLPLVLLAVGQLLLLQRRRTIQVWFDPNALELDDELISIQPGTPCGRLSGKDLAYSFFRQSHDFEIVTHRFFLLAAIGLLSLAEAWFASWALENQFEAVGSLYTIGVVWFFTMSLAMRWVWERRMLRMQGISIGSLSVNNGQLRYHFVDPHGEYRGATCNSVFSDRSDDMTLIFYDQDNPDRSVAASGLVFHKLIWKETPLQTAVSA